MTPEEASAVLLFLGVGGAPTLDLDSLIKLSEFETRQKRIPLHLRYKRPSDASTTEVTRSINWRIHQRMQTTPVARIITAAASGAKSASPLMPKPTETGSGSRATMVAHAA
jgi:hypothetical protein